MFVCATFVARLLKNDLNMDYCKTAFLLFCRHYMRIIVSRAATVAADYVDARILYHRDRDFNLFISNGHVSKSDVKGKVWSEVEGQLNQKQIRRTIVQEDILTNQT